MQPVFRRVLSMGKDRLKEHSRGELEARAVGEGRREWLWLSEALASVACALALNSYISQGVACENWPP